MTHRSTPESRARNPNSSPLGTHLLPDSIHRHIRSNRSNTLGNSLETIHKLALALVHDLVLCAKIIDIDRIACFVYQLAVRVWSSVFDLRSERGSASVSQRV
jgi:hypothetical protein